MKKLPLIPTLMVLFFVVLMTNMGFWQIRRAHEKEHIMDLLADEQITPITKKVQLKSLPRYASVKMKGRYLNSPQLLLDNQVNEGRQGYHVFTPFQLESEDKASIIMVNRGWLAKDGFNSETLAVEPKPTEISGKLNSSPKVGIQLGEVILKAENPLQVMTYYDDEVVHTFLYESACKSLSCTISQSVLLLGEKQTQGFKRDWKPVIMLPSKHIAYAVQWFAMTIVLLFIFVYWLKKTAQADED
jgi:surfeit locus 1 family protein